MWHLCMMHSYFILMSHICWNVMIHVPCSHFPQHLIWSYLINASTVTSVLSILRGARIAHSFYWVGCVLDGQGLVPDRGRGFCLCHSFHIGSGVHPAPYQRVTREPFPRSKAAYTWTWPLIPSSAVIKNAWHYISTPPYVLFSSYGS
jgi:hypothetical protein